MVAEQVVSLGPVAAASADQAVVPIDIDHVVAVRAIKRLGVDG